MTSIRVVVVVEGDSDLGAVRTYADRVGLDLAAEGITVRSAGGVTNFSRTLAGLAGDERSADVCGLYDIDDERHVRRALVEHRGLGSAEPVEAHGFYACVDDLEDELIRALGTSGVEAVLADGGELASFRRFQAMPQHRASPTDRQLHRFLGTRATRKIRMGTALVAALDPDRVPQPLRLLIDHLGGGGGALSPG